MLIIPSLRPAGDPRPPSPDDLATSPAARGFFGLPKAATVAARFIGDGVLIAKFLNRTAERPGDPRGTPLRQWPGRSASGGAAVAAVAKACLHFSGFIAWPRHGAAKLISRGYGPAAHGRLRIQFRPAQGARWITGATPRLATTTTEFHPPDMPTTCRSSGRHVRRLDT